MEMLFENKAEETLDGEDDGLTKHSHIPFLKAVRDFCQAGERALSSTHAVVWQLIVGNGVEKASSSSLLLRVHLLIFVLLMLLFFNLALFLFLSDLITWLPQNPLWTFFFIINVNFILTFFPQGQKSWQYRQLITMIPKQTTYGSSTG